MSNLDKVAFRDQIISSRSDKSEPALDSADKLFAQHDWADLIPGHNVACYFSLPPEPGTNELRAHLASLGKKVYLPIVEMSHSLSWGFDQAPYEFNKFGIAEPQRSDFQLADADAIILPALAADTAGNRLGRGAGYFDRALAEVPNFAAGGPLRIALVFDEEIFSEIPVEDHDAQVDLVVTPTRAITPRVK